MEVTPYLLDYGEILWVHPPIGRLIGSTGKCDDLMGGYSTAEWYERYRDIPGFEGLVCNVPKV